MSVVRAVSRNGEYSFSKPSRDEIVLVAGVGVEGDVHAGVTVRHRSRVKADPGQPNLRQVHLIHGELFDEVGASGHVVEPGQLGENVTTGGVDLLRLPRGTVLRFGHAPERWSGGAPVTRSGAAAERWSGAAPEEAFGGASEGRFIGAPERAGDGGRAGGPAVTSRDCQPVSESVAAVLGAAGRARLDASTAAAVVALAAAAAREEHVDDLRPAVVLTGVRNPCLQIDRFRDGLLRQVAYRDEQGSFVRKAGVMGVVLRGGTVRPGDPVTVDLPPLPHEPLDRI